MTENQIKVKADVATVKIGLIEFEGLLFETGEYGIAISQVADLIEASRNTASRDFKRILGENFKPSKVYTVFNRNTVNAINLDDFHKLMRALDKKGIKPAEEIMDVIGSVSFHQFFSDAFGIKFAEEDRQAFCIVRQSVKDSFKKYLTDSLKKAGFTQPREYGKFIHKMQAGLCIEDGTRDELDVKTLAKLNSAQEVIGMYINDFGVEPYKALEMCLSRYR
jgi:hypothetical protein